MVVTLRHSPTGAPDTNRRRHFFLGGQDLEMLEIRRLLERHAPDQVSDKGLAWGARLSDYRGEIETAVAAGLQAVAIELTDDLPTSWPPRRHLHLVDHHGARAGAATPSSLRQVFDLLGLPRRHWTRRMALVAANDIGHIDGMVAIGATRADIRRIRAADRRAQGATLADEREARRAIAARQTTGDLTVVVTGSATSSAIADFMRPEFDGPGYAALLVLMPGKLGFFGPGRVVQHMAAAVRGSWSGGALPDYGYWGAPAATRARRTALATMIADACGAGGAT